MGFFQIIAYINYKTIFGNNVALVVLGVLALLLGFFIVKHPMATLAIFIWLAGLYAFITGIASIIFAMQLKKITNKQ